MRRGISGVVAGLLLAALAPLGVAPAALAEAGVCPSGALDAADLPAEVSLADCDLVGRTVTYEGLSAPVPPPGRGLSQVALTEAGEISLEIETSAEGVVAVDAHSATVADPAPAAPTNPFSTAAAPNNDNFAAAVAVAVPTGFMPTDGTVLDVTETTLEPGEPTGCDPTATGSVWYRITRPDSLQRIKLQSGTNIMGVYTGAAVGNLSRLACVPGDNLPRHVAIPPGRAVFVQSLINPDSFVSDFFLYSGEMRPDGALPCQAKAHTLIDPSPRRKLTWRYNDADGPAGITFRQALGGVKRGVSVITGSKNDCGMDDRVSARAEYLGKTRKRASLCLGRLDGVNAIAYGPAPFGMLGLACSTWTIQPDGSRNVIESDIRLTQTVSWTLAPDAPSCRDEMDLVGVVAHESGHVFGLDHAGGTAGLNQTMAPSSSACNGAARSLGRGDVLGLRKLY